MRRVGQLVPALALLACGSDGGPIVPERGPVNIFTGTFTLVTLDGGSLPATFPPVGAPVEITSGSIHAQG